MLALVGTKITGILLFVIGIILISLGVFLHFAIPSILQNNLAVDENQRHVLTMLSGTLGSVLTGGLVALGITDMVISIGLIKKKRWAWKALLILTAACVSLNILFVVGMPSYASTMMIIIGAIADGLTLLYVYKKYNKISLCLPES